MDFSVIVLSYNNSLEQILLTVKSILRQEKIEFELIFADDCSEFSHEEQIKQYLDRHSFYSYRFAEHIQNVGTVKNILRALKYCKGDYVKCIGAGDLLYDELILFKVLQKMKKEDLNFIFTDFRAYRINNHKIVDMNYKAPLIIEPYKEKDLNKILYNVIISEDFISGSTMYFRLEFFYKYIKKIENIVTYKEDILQVLILLDSDTLPYYMPIRSIIYEVGTGISTQRKNKKNRNKMHCDDENFWGFVINKYSEKDIIKKKARSLEKRKNSGKMFRAFYSFWINPQIFFCGFIRNHIRYSPHQKLGFLDNKDFLNEFNLFR